jgi:lysophospholipase L1-like esterase
MLLGWIITFAIQCLRGKRAWAPLAGAVLVVLLKRVDWAPWLLALLSTMLVSAAADWILSRRPWISARLICVWAVSALLATWIPMTVRWYADSHTTRRPVFSEARPIVCVGDSLAAKGFPRILAGRVRAPIVDLAFPGITLAEGRERLMGHLRDHPQAVVIELGGHDYLKGRSRDETKAALEAMILEVRAAGAEPILFEIPRGVVVDGYGGLERELARAHDIELIGDGAIRQLIFFSPLTPLSWTGRKLSNDGLHPNDQGHEFLAGRVLEALKRIFGDAALRNP